MTQINQSALTSHSPTTPANYRVQYRTAHSDDPLDLMAQVESLMRMLNQRLEVFVGDAKWPGINIAQPRLPDYAAQSWSYWDATLGSVVFTTRLEEPIRVDRFLTGLTYRFSVETIPESFSPIHSDLSLANAPFDWLEPFFAALSTWTDEPGSAVAFVPTTPTSEAARFVTVAPHDEIATGSNNGKDGELFDPIYGSALLAIQNGIVERGAPRHFIGSIEDLSRDEDELQEPNPKVIKNFAEDPYRPEFGRGPFRQQKR